MAVKWIFLWMGPGLSKAEVIHCLVRGRRTPENRPRCLRQRGRLGEALKSSPYVDLGSSALARVLVEVRD